MSLIHESKERLWETLRVEDQSFWSFLIDVSLSSKLGTEWVFEASWSRRKVFELVSLETD